VCNASEVFETTHSVRLASHRRSASLVRRSVSRREFDLAAPDGVWDQLGSLKVPNISLLLKDMELNPQNHVLLDRLKSPSATNHELSVRVLGLVHIGICVGGRPKSLDQLELEKIRVLGCLFLV